MKMRKDAFFVKLFKYFVLFGALLVAMLWLMQSVFFSAFYQGMKTKDIEKVAQGLKNAYGQGDFEETLDKAAYDNSILVYITDLSGNLIYATDEHTGPKLPDGKSAMKKDSGNFRPLPEDYSSFVKLLNESESGQVSYTVEKKHFNNGTTLVYGLKLKDAMMYISTPLDPVEATVGILRTQLVYVTAAALLLSFVIAFLLARRFSRPIGQLTNQAQAIAKGGEAPEYEKGFCVELDTLSDTLSYAGGEIQKVEKLRNELVANISHDLRTPLTLIKSYSEMIRDISGDNKEKREAHVEVIISETDRLVSLVNDILALSAIQSGNAALNLDGMNLSETVKKVLSRFEPVFKNEGIVVKTGIEADQYVYADEMRMMQVLYNLIGNALHHAGDSKSVEVNVKNLGACARVEVIDHGDGIEKDELNRIWERYYRRSAGGTGLGLSIVKGILEQHGARYGVQSEIGKGSTFWLEIKK